MKKPVVQFSIVVLAFVAVAAIFGYAKPVADEPKEYVIVVGNGAFKGGGSLESFEAEISKKLSVGWHCEGGPFVNGAGCLCQAMVK